MYLNGATCSNEAVEHTRNILQRIFIIEDQLHNTSGHIFNILPGFNDMVDTNLKVIKTFQILPVCFVLDFGLLVIKVTVHCL